jgi:hypothetical protein
VGDTDAELEVTVELLIEAVLIDGEFLFELLLELRVDAAG